MLKMMSRFPLTGATQSVLSSNLTRQSLKSNSKQLPMTAGGCIPNVSLLDMGRDLQILPCNGMVICLPDPQSRRGTGTHHQKLANSKHILCFQEVHGYDLLPNWRRFFSTPLSHDGSALPNSGEALLLLVAPRSLNLVLVSWSVNRPWEMCCCFPFS